MITSLSLQAIASAGGSVIVSAADFTVISLKAIASAGKTNGVELIVKDANKLTSLNCKSIASANPGHVTFDFT